MLRATGELRARHATRHVPVVLLTARSDTESKVEALEAAGYKVERPIEQRAIRINGQKFTVVGVLAAFAVAFVSR